MKTRSYRFEITLLSLILLFSISCSKDDNKVTDPGSNGNSNNVTGQMTSFINSIDQDYFQSNAKTINSLEYFIPIIEGVVKSNGIVKSVTPKTAVEGCFAGLQMGATYAFNGNTYAPDGTTEAQPNEVRFRLYFVDSSGYMHTDIPIGLGLFGALVENTP